MQTTTPFAFVRSTHLHTSSSRSVGRSVESQFCRVSVRNGDHRVVPGGLSYNSTPRATTGIVFFWCTERIENGTRFLHGSFSSPSTLNTCSVTQPRNNSSSFSPLSPIPSAERLPCTVHRGMSFEWPPFGFSRLDAACPFVRGTRGQTKTKPSRSSRLFARVPPKPCPPQPARWFAMLGVNDDSIQRANKQTNKQTTI
jgi:hypothetical protein